MDHTRRESVYGLHGDGQDRTTLTSRESSAEPLEAERDSTEQLILQLSTINEA